MVMTTCAGNHVMVIVHAAVDMASLVIVSMGRATATMMMTVRDRSCAERITVLGAARMTAVLVTSPEWIMVAKLVLHKVSTIRIS